MRHIMRALLLASPLLAAACSSNSDENAATNVEGQSAAAPPLYKNIPGPITGNRANGINSSFRIIQAAGGIPSDRYGGACIVFRAVDLGYQTMGKIQCTKDEDCATPEAEAHYCQLSTKQCLARPNPTGAKDPYCNRSIDPEYSPPKQWPADTDIQISATPVPVPSTLVPNGKAYLITLLKRKAPANAPPVTEIGSETPIP